MTTPVSLNGPATPSRSGVTNREADARLQQIIEHAAHLLPAQGPIPVFIHHNTLHAFEDMPFSVAVQKAAGLFGCQPYMSKARYRAELARGRIRFGELQAVLQEDLGPGADQRIARLCTRLELRLAMLLYPFRYGPTEELLWFVAETDALRRVRPDASAACRGRLIAETRRWVMRDLRAAAETGRPSNGARRSAWGGLSLLLERFGEARIETWSDDVWEAFTLHSLWRVCCDGIAGLPDAAPPAAAAVRHRDLLLQAGGADADLLVHDLLIRFCGAFLDQGLAHWQLPGRDQGVYRAFCALYRQPAGPPEPWLGELADRLAHLEHDAVSPLECIRESLQELGIAEEEWGEYVSATLLALRGWAGIMQFLEERPERAVHPVPAGSLIEFLAIRLLLDRLALADVARTALGYAGPLRELREMLRRGAVPPAPPSVAQRAFLVFQLAQVLGSTPQELHALDNADWSALLAEIEVFSSIDRRRIFHLAYERRFYTQVLDALTLHNRGQGRSYPPPRFQALFCIDEREESIRRHIEEVAPDAVTFGIAGFYFLDMYYRGVEDAHFVALCPALMRPGHWVVERPAQEEAHRRAERTRRALGKATHLLHSGSRKFVLGAVVSGLVGVLASLPLIARTLFPRLTARLRRAFGRIILDPPPTELVLERTEPDAGPGDGHVGYTLDEMTAIAERVLRDTGLTSGFARLVLTFGHGSTSMNNPHESAHDCGACGGGRGGPNGRAIAHILNDPRIRERLRGRGLVMPAKTVFVGGMLNSSSEEVSFYDLELVPDSHRAEFAEVRALIELAADRDAHERCRRFESAPLTLSFQAARQHVEGRAEDLSQVRPEWGHATNAVTIVGRRERTRGLFLDRRAFLNSYDPTQDDADGTILGRILQAVVPVCAGISLEYYFSFVDNPGYGCGTKLPHNIAALLGVMDGAASDLRTGLPWQMVEIHEPVRQLFVIETRPETMLRVLERNPDIKRLVRNDWIRLALLDPDAATVKMYHDDGFRDYQPQAEELPRAASSVDWYRGWRDHLEFAQIGAHAS